MQIKDTKKKKMRHYHSKVEFWVGGTFASIRFDDVSIIVFTQLLLFVICTQIKKKPRKIATYVFFFQYENQIFIHYIVLLHVEHAMHSV